MKTTKNLFISILFALPCSLFAQWQPINSSATDSGPIYHLNGNVGIGTDNPASPLHVSSDDVSIPPVRISTTDASLEFSRHSLDLRAKSTFSFVPYVAWVTGQGVRQGYMGWRNDVLSLSLENGFDLSVNGGNVGIGTTAPRGKLDVDGPGDIYLCDDIIAGTGQSLFLPGHIYISPYNGGNVSFLQARRSDNSGTTSFRIRTWNNGVLNESVHIEGNGNVGIGTTVPNEKLTVLGTIYGKEVRVDLSVPGPDYVFADDYDLPTLASVESFIKVNKHLPDVPAAGELESDGINLGEMNMLLLKKVEELTLYLIEQQREIESLKASLQKR